MRAQWVRTLACCLKNCPRVARRIRWVLQPLCGRKSNVALGTCARTRIMTIRRSRLRRRRRVGQTRNGALTCLTARNLRTNGFRSLRLTMRMCHVNEPIRLCQLPAGVRTVPMLAALVRWPIVVISCGENRALGTTPCTNVCWEVRPPTPPPEDGCRLPVALLASPLPLSLSSVAPSNALATSP